MSPEFYFRIVSPEFYFKNSNELGRLKYDNLSYWSAGKNSIEVDFILERNQENIGIEVKPGVQLSSKWVSGLKALKDSGHIKRAILVYLGSRKYRHSSGIKIYPLQHFLKEFPEL